MKLQINSLSNHSGKELRQLRERMGLSQSALSELMGIKQAKLSSFELEKSSLNDIELVKLKSTLLDDISIEKRLNRKKRYKQSSKNINIIQGMKLNRTYKKSERNSEYIDVLKNLWLKHTDNNKKINTISLFSGCGGFSLGASAAGFKIIGNVEKEAGAQRIYSTNFDSNFLGADITQINDANLKRIAGDLPPVRVIIGGPPCQGFSLTGKRNHEDKRNYLFKDYLRFIKVFNPVVAVMENVEKLLSMKGVAGTPIIHEIEKEFGKLGYMLKYKTVNAAEYGVAQNRNRVIFIATKSSQKKSIFFPEPLFFISQGQLRFKNEREQFAFADAVSDLPFLESGESSPIPYHDAVTHPLHVIKWLWDVPQGKSAHENIDPLLRPPSGYNTTYKRQYWSKPASTVQTTFGMISGSNNVHPIATRSLTIRESARIQSFPDEFQFIGSKGEIRRAIGNAVPPLLAKFLMEHIRSYIL